MKTKGHSFVEEILKEEKKEKFLGLIPLSSLFYFYLLVFKSWVIPAEHAQAEKWGRLKYFVNKASNNQQSFPTKQQHFFSLRR